MKALYRPISISSLVFFRICFGVLAFSDMLGSWIYKHLYKQSFHPDQFQFRYYGFEWLPSFPEPWMSLFFLASLAAAVGITLGWRYRLCCTFYAFAFTYVFLLEKSYYLNHGYLFCVLSFLMIALPADRQGSIRAYRDPSYQWSKIPYWPIFLLQLSMGIVYFFGGIAKINSDWLNGMPLKLWLKAKSDMFLLGPLWEQEWVAYFMSYGGLMLDLFAAPMLAFRRTRIWFMIFVLFFHTTNLIIFKIGIFPFLSIALSLLFFPPDLPQRWLSALARRFKRLQAWLTRWPQSTATPSWRPSFILPMLIMLYGLIHISLPLRHHYFPGDVAWTEEGHRYSWRMMLRSKRGYGRFKVVDKATGETSFESPKDYLSKKQARKMFTHPDMILQFAHFLRDHYKTTKGMDVQVFAQIKARLNGRKYQKYIDPTVDLAKEEWKYFEISTWIIPFERTPYK